MASNRSSTSQVISTCSWVAVGAPRPGPPAPTPTTGRRSKGTPLPQLPNHPSPLRGVLNGEGPTTCSRAAHLERHALLRIDLVPRRLLVTPRILTPGLRRPTATPARQTPSGLLRMRAAYLCVRSAQRNRMRVTVGQANALRLVAFSKHRAYVDGATTASGRTSRRAGRHLAVDRLRPVHPVGCSEEPSVVAPWRAARPAKGTRKGQPYSPRFRHSLEQVVVS